MAGTDSSASSGSLGRRDFLRASTLSALPAGLASGGMPGDRAVGATGGPPPPMILRSLEPEALEFPFASLDGFLTPNERFYVLSHFKAPRLDPHAWRLTVEGLVDRPLELGLDDLKAMPGRREVALLECSGNGRVFLEPKVYGVPWELGGVGNAEWVGVPLADVLDRAGVKAEAVEVILEGADRGEVREEPKTPGVIPFARSLPIAKARRDVLLAYRMNGSDLPIAHGFPLRAVVPGWHGVASVKWLSRIVAVETPYRGYFQSLQYAYFGRRDGRPDLVQVTEVGVKAQVARPGRGEIVPRGSEYRAFGAAWAGESEVAGVEVSTDGGKSWAMAKLLGESVRNAWRLWEFPWRAPEQAGPRTVMARARDVSGRVQPMTRDQDRRNYMVSHVLPVDIEVG